MKKVPSIVLLLLVCTFLFSQDDQRIAKSKIPITEVEQVIMPFQDNVAYFNADLCGWAMLGDLSHLQSACEIGWNPAFVCRSQ